MAVNLLEMAKGYLTDAVINRVSGSLNESPENTQKALTGALPVFLSGLISRSSSPDGPGFLTGMLQNFMQGPSASVQPPADEDHTAMMQQGGGLLNSIFGSSSGLISGALAQYAGVKSESASGLMGMAGSVITGLLGRQMGSQGAGGLVSLLADQREAVTAAMPSGLSSLMGNIPGLSALGGLTGSAGSALSGVTGSLGSAIGGASSVASTAFNDVRGSATGGAGSMANDDRGGKGFNFLPWVLGAIAIAALVYFLRGCGDKKDSTAVTSSTMNDTTSASTRDVTATADTIGNTAGAMMDTASSAVGEAADKVGDAISGAAASLGAFGAKKLPDGVELNIPANGVENRLIAFIEDKSKEVDKKTWFDFDRLLFETGSAKLKPESREQLQNMAAILKAYPAVNLKIGGYTDNTGNAANNKKLSQQRADAAMAELVKLGVSKTRLEAEGYGQEIPIADNSTAEGRQKNRRTSVRITKK
ncbi:OmpA family protein [Fibrella aquatilis]|uniref:OmpA family protein n=1 Tax=Fibrella aquatilis TaxID=2817059 RepID=A0A939GDB7_9BACT|nr:OmpA family protein [Fibrella aquatilis]MBO0934755.1 OmpA family protein [Fibrella aquatilis]